jgi:hypothetical protein
MGKRQNATGISWQRHKCNEGRALGPHTARTWKLEHPAMDVLPMPVEGGAGPVVALAADGRSVTIQFSSPRTRLSALLYTVRSG